MAGYKSKYFQDRSGAAEKPTASAPSSGRFKSKYFKEGRYAGKEVQTTWGIPKVKFVYKDEKPAPSDQTARTARKSGLYSAENTPSFDPMEAAKQNRKGFEQAKNWLKGNAQSYGGSMVNAGGTIVDLLQNNNSYTAGQRRRIENEKAYLKDMQTKLSQTHHPVERNKLEQQIKRKQNLINTLTGEIKREQTYTKPVVDKLYSTADRLTAEGEKNLSAAKQDTTKLEQFLQDTGSAGVQMAADIGIGALTGGSALPAMALRSGGAAAGEARRAGATLDQSALYGLGSGALSVATEKISNVAGPFKKYMGKGIAERMAPELVKRLTQSSAGRALLMSAAGEGFEEFVEAALQPVLQQAVFGQKEDFNWNDAMYDAAVGALLGGIGGGMEIGQTAKLGMDVGRDLEDSDVRAFIEEGLSAPEGTAANKLAHQYQDRMNSGKRLNAYQLGNLYRENINSVRGDAYDGMTDEEILEELGGRPSEPTVFDGMNAEEIAEAMENGTEIQDTEDSPYGPDTNVGSRNAQKRVEEAQRRLREAVDNGAPPEQIRALEAIVVDAKSRVRPDTFEERKAVAENATTTPFNAFAPSPAEKRAYAQQRQQKNMDYGEEGQKAVNSIGIRTPREYAGFSAYYNAGVSGYPAESVNTRFSGEVAPEVAQIAWNAGKMDAMTSLGNEMSATRRVDRTPGLDKSSPYLKKVNRRTRRALDRLGKSLGVAVRFVSREEDGGNNGWYQNGVIYISEDARNPIRVVATHEATHRLQRLAPEQYRAYRDMAVNIKSERLGGDTSSLIEAYRKKYPKENNEGIMDEIAADYTEELINNSEEFRRLVMDDRSMAEKLVDALREVIRKIKAAIAGGNTEQDAELAKLEDAVKAWEAALKEGVKAAQTATKDKSYYNAEKNAAQDGDVKYSLNSKFPKQFDGWYHSKEFKDGGPGRFLIGTTSDALKSIGVSDYNIYWNKKKLRKIMTDHPEMTAEAVKQVPDILENPVIVMQSSTRVNRITLFGELFSEGGAPIMVAVELTPTDKTGQINDFAVVASSYGKGTKPDGSETGESIRNAVQKMIDEADILYLDPDKKRTDSWLKQIRLQLPSRITSYGSIHNVTLVTPNVKGNYEFGDSGKSAMAAAFEKAGFSAGEIGDKITGEKKQASIKRTVSGDPVAVVDNDILSSIDTSEWNYAKKRAAQKAAEIALRKFKDGIYVGGTKYGLNKKARDEYARSNDADRLYRKSKDVFADKLRAADNLDDVIKATNDWSNDNGLSHERKDNFVDFLRGVVLIQSGENQYKAVTVVGITERGEYIFRDVTHIEPTRFKIKEESPHSALSSDASSAILGDSSNGRVTEDGMDVNKQFSKKGTSNIERDLLDLKKENDLLRERVDYWKGQTKRTTKITTDTKSVAKAAKELIRAYGADIEAEEIAADLQSLYDYMASPDVSYTESRKMADDIASKLVENALAVDDELYDQYGDLRKYAKTTQFLISENDAKDIPDYAEWRRSVGGKIKLKKGDRSNVDSIYGELAELWPEWFDAEEAVHPADQLMRLADVLDDIYSITEYNPYDSDIQGTTTSVANDILDKFFDLPQTKATFADKANLKKQEAVARQKNMAREAMEKQKARAEELRKKNAEKAQERLKKEKAKNAERIQKLKDRNKAKTEKDREARSARELRAKVLRHVKKLSAKLRTPSDKQHIPEDLRVAVATMLDAINLESLYTTDPETGKRVKGGNGDPTKRTEAFHQLQDAYKQIMADGQGYTLVLDPDLEDNISEVIAMKDIPIAAMTVEQLQTVWATVKAVEASVSTADKMLAQSRFQNIKAFADGLRLDNTGKKLRGNYRGILGDVDSWVNTEMLTPEAFFHRLGDTGEELFRMMRRAQDQHIRIMDEARAATESIVDGADVSKLEKETHTFDIDGQKLTMSTAQIMSLYELIKRPQAKDHILIGGIRPEALTEDRGIKQTRKADPIHVTEFDLNTIFEVLTDEQKKMADAMQKYMSEHMAKLGNEASLKVYGYKKFNEKDYYPIKVDKNTTQTDVAKQATASTIAGRGFTKAVSPKAKNAVMVDSIFDTYAAHINDMATYAAWLPTMEDIRRIRDFTFRDEETKEATGTVKAIIETVFGRDGNGYLNKLIDDLNQGVKSDGRTPFDALVRNYKLATVSANLRVVLQQPTAIIRASSMIDPKYLVKGAARKGNWDLVKKYAPIAIWKDWGYFDISTGRQMKDVLLNSETKLQKAQNVGMELAGKADSISWSRLWNAVEEETKDKRPGLEAGSDAFYRAVAERFNEIIDRTQVVDGILQRSGMMRRNGLKTLTSYMAEPTKSYNMVTSAIYDLKVSPKDTIKAAQKALARSLASLVVAQVVNAVAQSIPDAFRDDDREKDYWEKFIENYWDNLASSMNPVEYIPWFKDIISISKGYDVRRMDMEGISRMMASAATLTKSLKGESKASVPAALADFMARSAALFGIPVHNVKRDVMAIINTVANESGNYWLQYQIDKALLDIQYSNNASAFSTVLYNAWKNDKATYQRIYDDMKASGFDMTKINGRMDNLLKKEKGVTSVSDLDQRYMTPEQEKRYSGHMKPIKGTSAWRSAPADRKKAVEEYAYQAATGDIITDEWDEKLKDASIPESEFILYKLALKLADEANSNGKYGTYTNDEKKAALDIAGIHDSHTINVLLGRN